MFRPPWTSRPRRPLPGARGARPASRYAGPAAWQLAGRAVWTPRRAPTPGAITHATLNRYGPDTKAAVVLTGANRLLRDVTAAIASVCRSLADQDAAPEIRLAVWAGLVLEAFRGQPALVAAAVQAREIQRALTTPWGEYLELRGLTTSARCEFGAAGIADRERGRRSGREQPASADPIRADRQHPAAPAAADPGDRRAAAQPGGDTRRHREPVVPSAAAGGAPGARHHVGGRGPARASAGAELRADRIGGRALRRRDSRHAVDRGRTRGRGSASTRYPGCCPRWTRQNSACSPGARTWSARTRWPTTCGSTTVSCSRSRR